MSEDNLENSLCLPTVSEGQSTMIREAWQQAAGMEKNLEVQLKYDLSKPFLIVDFLQQGPKVS